MPMNFEPFQRTDISMQTLGPCPTKIFRLTITKLIYVIGCEPYLQLHCVPILNVFFCRNPLGLPKIKNRSKNGPNVNRKRLYILLTDLEPQNNVTVYIFHGDRWG